MRAACEDTGGGVYRMKGSWRWPGAVRAILPGAFAPLPDGRGAGRFGWIGGVCPAPSRRDRYVVQFLSADDRTFRFLAYIDRYGRAFSCTEPVAMPPARTPDLDFARFPGQEGRERELGCVEVYRGTDGRRQVACYAFEKGRYRLSDSWLDFDEVQRGGMGYDDAMARAYLAFVHRPACGGAPIPSRGLLDVEGILRSRKDLSAPRRVAALVDEAAADPALRPPALARALVRWLREAGLDDIAARGVGDEELRVVRSTRYAGLFYVAPEKDDCGATRREVWALEAALNRYALTADALGEAAASANDRQVAEADGALATAAFCVDIPASGLVSDAANGTPDEEWAVRCDICSAYERLRIPIRTEMALRLDLKHGEAAFELVAPDAELMPRAAGRQAAGNATGSTPATAQAAARRRQARDYAMRVGIMAARIAFRASPRIERVDVVAWPFFARDRAGGRAASETAGSTASSPAKAFYKHTFHRRLVDDDDLSRALAGDPCTLYLDGFAKLDVAGADAFAAIRTFETTRRRRVLPELQDARLDGDAAQALGTQRASGLRIEFEAYRRSVAEKLADRIVRCQTATDAIRIAREEQERAAGRRDERIVDACNRLMTGLADGTLDAHDQNAIVGRFLGEDRCLVALGRARTMAEHDASAAVDMLIDAVAEASALDGFVDGTKTAYRYFDSYASRLTYNQALARARAGCVATASGPSPDLASMACADAQRSVQLVPDSFYLCNLEIVRLLEHSFERTDDALRYGRRTIELAPATAAGYRQMGRALMLVGDMDNAAATLKSGLGVALQPADIALAYYQLAYVLWKADDTKGAGACYVKSLDTSPVAALQATVELKELVGETKEPPPRREAVDETLDGLGLPIAPAPQLLDSLAQGAAAATDAGLFPVARNLLALRLRYRPDDALTNVLYSLEDPPSRTQ